MGYGQLKPEGYLPRIADRQLERMLAAFGAVEVAGTMWCGKTWTSLAFGQSVTRIGLARPRAAAEYHERIHQKRHEEERHGHYHLPQ
jgi:hypothetical protein